jgi:hypothetical protein
MRDGLTPVDVASFALEYVRRSIGLSIANPIVCESVEHVLRVAVLPFALTWFQAQF